MQGGLDSVEAASRDGRLLSQRVRRLRAAREHGRSWGDILNAEPDPGALQLVTRMLARLSSASGSLRTALARALRSEAEAIPGIAARFGVSHQRISAILRRSSD
ncbi:MAG TPA: hypothetical protein VKG43_06145 [Acidimicrobiales bacterium]|nr:hypothetical protein [Acidimicrobiales bacterium]